MSSDTTENAAAEDQHEESLVDENITRDENAELEPDTDLVISDTNDAIEEDTPSEQEIASAELSEEETRERIIFLKPILEGAILAVGEPLRLDKMQSLFDEYEVPSKGLLIEALESIQKDFVGRGIELVQVASGWRFQVREGYAAWVNRLWDEKPQKYSRALLETLALIAYRQPLTRGDIEQVRGVAVSSHIIKTLVEREWVKVVGHRDVPGRPALYATTRQFLDYFNLKSLDELPTLGELKDFDNLNATLDLTEPDAGADNNANADTNNQAHVNSSDEQSSQDALAPTADDGQSSELEESSVGGEPSEKDMEAFSSIDEQSLVNGEEPSSNADAELESSDDRSAEDAGIDVDVQDGGEPSKDIDQNTELEEGGESINPSELDEPQVAHVSERDLADKPNDADSDSQEETDV